MQTSYTLNLNIMTKLAEQKSFILCKDNRHSINENIEMKVKMKRNTIND
jgi:hypothetical protein